MLETSTWRRRRAVSKADAGTACPVNSSRSTAAIRYCLPMRTAFSRPLRTYPLTVLTCSPSIPATCSTEYICMSLSFHRFLYHSLFKGVIEIFEEVYAMTSLTGAAEPGGVTSNLRQVPLFVFSSVDGRAQTRTCASPRRPLARADEAFNQPPKGRPEGALFLCRRARK